MASYARLYADEDGESHFADVDVKLEPVDFAPPAPPLDLSEPYQAERFVFVGVAAGWEGEWHPAPQRQFVFCLTGTLEVGASDGEVRNFSPGDVLLLEDTTGKGHSARVTSAEYALMAMVQME